MARKKDWNLTLEEAHDTWTFAFDNNADGNPVYIGKAFKGNSDKAQPVWQIRKLTYSGQNVTDIQWAGGDDAFNQVWDDRASLSYS